MLSRVKIEGYKSLRNIEISLEPLSVFFGPNAAGKSNFLDALQLLSRTANSKELKDAFDSPYRGAPLESFSFGSKGIKSILEKETATFCIEVDVELSSTVKESVEHQVREMRRGKSTNSEGTKKNSKTSFVREDYLRYRLEIEILPNSGILRVKDEYLAALKKDGQLKQSRKPFLERVNDKLHLRMEGQSHPTYYESYLNHTILSMPVYPPHYPHLVAMRQELSSWFFFYFEPRERMRAPNPVKEVRHIGLMGEELAAFLNTLKVLDPRQFRGVEKSLCKIIPSITGIDVGVDDLGEVEFQIREGNTPIPARVLSEGTLRILGLLALRGVRETPGLLGFEEPENGIHPKRVRLIAELLNTYTNDKDTQIIATTHSPILPDLIPENSLYVCRKKDGSTTITSFSTFGPLMKQSDIDQGLDELSKSELILRGDLDV
ncbi:MAG: AAA family ATPase [Spirulinaceae cyanobacterium]